MKNIFRHIKRSAFTFPLAVATALILLVISESAYHSSVASLDELGQMGSARINNLKLLRQVLDAENGQRGYLITGRAEYLKPYRSAMAGIGETMNALAKHYADMPDQIADFTMLASLVSKKLSEMETTVKLRAEGREDAWRAVIETDIGREQMDSIRQAAERLIERENTKITRGRADVYETLMLSRLGVSAMTALSVLAFFMYLRQSATLERERVQQRDALESERDLLEQQVLVRTRQLTELAQHLQNAREDERSRLARDLHDELGALLTAAKLDVARLKSKLGTAMTPDIVERLAHMNESLNNGIALKRRIIEDLRPSSLSNLGLVAALEILAREFAERSGIQVECQLEPAPMTPSSELTVYRLVQEALTNIAKYAQARHVTIRLKAQDQRAEVSVRDDGVGFDTSEKRPSTHGLLGMRYRVEAERGRMQIESRPGEGTHLQASLPLRST